MCTHTRETIAVDVAEGPFYDSPKPSNKTNVLPVLVTLMESNIYKWLLEIWVKSIQWYSRYSCHKIV